MSTSKPATAKVGGGSTSACASCITCRQRFTTCPPSPATTTGNVRNWPEGRLRRPDRLGAAMGGGRRAERRLGLHLVRRHWQRRADRVGAYWQLVPQVG